MPERHSADIELFIDTLPDPAGARAFLRRLEALDPAVANDSKRNPLLLSRILTLAGQSPYLAETLLRHPEHIAWLRSETERHFDRVKSVEQLSEELARFITRTIEADDPMRLARFKRRELLRIYLRDCLGIATLSEVTEELSNLADVILRYSLARAYQEMVNLRGAPLVQDQRGRIENAELAIVALGKLGCRELNYASDIDLLFLYSGEGETSGDSRRVSAPFSNKEFFSGVAERVVQMIARSSEEGAVYRIDLRLRPYGRDGDLVWAIDRAADYYCNRAHNWERQALIRARAAAGNEEVVSRFLEMVRDAIFTRDALPDTLDSVRRAKEKIDRKEASRARGFNVKLGPGGIREIEFIAQALQLKHGGREPWVRSAQTLIVLARLAEKRYLTESERTRLSAAYTFLRTVEHRLQMEHGAQTHTLPTARPKLEMLARRCGYGSADKPAARFKRDLESHTSAVRAVYNRVFGDASRPEALADVQHEDKRREGVDNESARVVKQAATRLSKVVVAGGAEMEPSLRHEIESAIASALPNAINPSRSLRNLTAWADSFATYTQEQTRAIGWPVSNNNWLKLVERLVLVLSSQYLSHLLISRPMLATAFLGDEAATTRADFFRVMREAVDKESDPASKTDALRHAWYRLVVEIGYKDLSVVGGYKSVAGGRWPVAGLHEVNGGAEQPTTGYQPPTTDHPPPVTTDHLRENNLDQTALAEAALRIAAEIALQSIGIGHLRPDELPFTILGLGRLGHAGMDYGSDLDLLVVFDDDSGGWPPAALGNAAGAGNSPLEFYARLTSELVRVLSSITREGLLYRTDLRLRPEGKNGALAIAISNLVAYITNRASAWEHSAYLKAREVAGDLQFGERARKAICDACFEAASRNDSLREELSNMHTRLVREKARGARPNIKWGRGGMTDVYFVTRYLQLRDRIYFPPERGTSALIVHLGEQGALEGVAARALFEGYGFLRRLDHWMRLLLDRPTPVLPASSVAARDIARALGISSVEEFEELFARHTAKIDEVYNLVFG
jgi:[glutamine synthetase] adenylyltransferase / [glutamine synthetase]-adenylyl-L-tyrosine phosphorylase